VPTAFPGLLTHEGLSLDYRNATVALRFYLTPGTVSKPEQGEPTMLAVKQIARAAIATALLCVPMAPAMAAGPLLFAPWLLGRHVVGAVTRLATLPLVAASAAASALPPAVAYSAPGGYYGQSTYYPSPPAYYGASRAYYPPVVSYPYYSAPGYYGPPRGYYAPAPRYSGYYGAQAFYRSRGYSYRRR